MQILLRMYQQHEKRQSLDPRLVWSSNSISHDSSSSRCRAKDGNHGKWWWCWRNNACSDPHLIPASFSWSTMIALCFLCVTRSRWLLPFRSRGLTGFVFERFNCQCCGTELSLQLRQRYQSQWSWKRVLRRRKKKENAMATKKAASELQRFKIQPGILTLVFEHKTIISLYLSLTLSY